ncbi:hypothetical protein AC1031_009174 [Aphanomyces cochlioides]|nr:hypothetical protein AC1031_009174 [Aphanomyces cochlioides]
MRHESTTQLLPRLAYAAIYLAAVVLLTGAPTHQCPALTSQRSADPFTLYPTLVAPMVSYYYRTSPHLDSYFYMAYAALVAIFLPPLATHVWRNYRARKGLRRVGSDLSKLKMHRSYSSLDVAVGLAIRFPGGFMDTTRLYARQRRPNGPKSTVYSLANGEDGCVMRTSSV